MYLERFSESRLTAIGQGIAVRGLIKQNEEWLSEAQPDTVRRYRSTPHAIRSVRRLAGADPDFNAFIILEELRGPALGLATLIANQTIEHPDSKIGVKVGNDLDYWLTPDTSMDIHHATAEALLKRSGIYSLHARGEIHSTVNTITIPDAGLSVSFASLAMRTKDQAFAVIPQNSANPPEGLRAVLEPVGDVASLSFPTGPGLSDKYHIAKDGAPSQLYYLEHPVSLASYL